MKTKILILIGALAVLLGSCIPSLYPLYREKDLLRDDRLPGRFETSEEDYWEFSDLTDPASIGGEWEEFKSGNTYRLRVYEEGIIEEFATHLLKLGNDFYLDFYPVDYSIEPALLEMSLAPSHIFAKVELDEQFIVLHFFDLDWLAELIEKDRIKISHLDLGQRYLLTARTEELQKFILKFANDSTTFMDADTLLRNPTPGMPEQITDFYLPSNPEIAVR